MYQIFNDKHFNDGAFVASSGISLKGLHSRMPDVLINQLMPYMKHINYPDSFNLYKSGNVSSQSDLLHELRKMEYYGMMQKTLTKVDRASMDNGLEIRVPFLLKKLIENILKINVQLHKPMQSRKRILCKILNILYPSKPKQKIKMGFSISLTNWINNQYNEPFKNRLLDNNFHQSIGLDAPLIKTMFDAHESGNRDYKWPLFTLYSLASWLDYERKKN